MTPGAQSTELHWERLAPTIFSKNSQSKTRVGRAVVTITSARAAIRHRFHISRSVSERRTTITPRYLSSGSRFLRPKNYSSRALRERSASRTESTFLSPSKVRTEFNTVRGTGGLGWTPIRCLRFAREYPPLEQAANLDTAATFSARDSTRGVIDGGTSIFLVVHYLTGDGSGISRWNLQINRFLSVHFKTHLYCTTII